MPVSLIHYHLMSLFDCFPRLLECLKALLNAFQMTPAHPHSVSPCSVSVTIIIALFKAFQTTPARPHSISPCSASVTIVIGQSLLLLLLIHLVGLDAR
ncbi:hypothetical protein EV421DRAFT_1777780 [Armillaria borealis]|uniref:Uncharacterized protein n=1 Tax=Armillaria borealis TaxID=47425 RepID=A0AA39MX74_9AGAR|nr:hypothetical protein EV421DRAFT_1777780 [Armillaria borealis]